MISGFHIAFRYLPLALGLVFAACERPQEARPAEPHGRLRAEDSHAEAAHGCSTRDEDAALAAINAARSDARQPAFSCLAKLSAMATAHAAFLASNENLSLASAHREQPGAPGYTGNTLGERAAYQGLDVAHFWLAEGAGGGAEAKDVVAAHLATVYHRSPLLAPGGRYFAFALGRGQNPHAVMNMLLWVTTDGLGTARWPAPGARGVAPNFNASGEKPEPRADPSRAGYPVSVHFPRYINDDGSEPAVAVDEFTLRDSRGSSVGAKVLSSTNDGEVYPSDAFLLPEDALTPGETYVVRARMTYGDLALDEEWEFTTLVGDGVLQVP